MGDSEHVAVELHRTLDIGDRHVHLGEWTEGHLGSYAYFTMAKG